MTNSLSSKSLLPARRNEFLTPFDSMFDEMMGKAFPDFSQEFGVNFFGNNSYPKVDIIDSEKNLIFEAEIPGLSKEEVSVDFEEGVLTIKGSKREDARPEDHKYVRKELKRSSFTRSFKLEDSFDFNKIKAKFENGLLLITVPKKKPEKSKKVKIL
jgi:HSP20 family protein